MNLEQPTHGGELIREGQKNGVVDEGQPKKEMGHDAPLLLKDIDIDPDQSKRAQKLAAIPIKTIKKYVKNVADHRDTGLLRFATGQKVLD